MKSERLLFLVINVLLAFVLGAEDNKPKTYDDDRFTVELIEFQASKNEQTKLIMANYHFKLIDKLNLVSRLKVYDVTNGGREIIAIPEYFEHKEMAWEAETPEEDASTGQLSWLTKREIVEKRFLFEIKTKNGSVINVYQDGRYPPNEREALFER